MSRAAYHQLFEVLRARTEAEFGAAVRVAPLELADFIGLRFTPVVPCGLRLDLFAENDWLRLVGPSEAHLDIEFSGGEGPAGWFDEAWEWVRGIGSHGGAVVWRGGGRQFVMGGPERSPRRVGAAWCGWV
jgi:hypothetical protein